MSEVPAATHPPRAGEALPRLRTLALLLAAAVGMGSTLVYASGPAHPLRALLPTAAPGHVVSLSSAGPGADGLLHARADTVRRDTTRRDSSASRASATGEAVRDTTGPDTSRVARYLTPFYQQPPFARRPGEVGLLGRVGDSYRREVLFDTLSQRYRISERVGGRDVRVPYSLSLDSFQALRFDEAVQVGFRDLAAQRARQAASRRSQGLLASIQIPGGRQSAFSTIFGKNEVSLRVTGNADVTAGFNYRTSQQSALTGRPYSLNPEFQQRLALGVTGSIGDKLNVNVNFDTESAFDYQNRVRLQYQGYEDEIIRSIEAGNVFLQTPSTLIRGGQSLFGIKSEFQIGGLRLTTVASQEEGQATRLDFSGGAAARAFEIRAVDYQDATHFFLHSYFRNHFEAALRDPSGVVSMRLSDDRGAPGVDRIDQIEVWREQQTVDNTSAARQRTAVALADLGEERAVLAQTVAAPYRRVVSPGLTLDQYDDAPGGEVDTRLRGQQDVEGFLAGRGLTQNDYVVKRFRKLEEGTDFTVDKRLGFVSLRQRLAEGEALAVSYRVQLAGGGFAQVGDFSSTSTSQNTALVLKLIRPERAQAPAGLSGPLHPTWALEMRNVYSLGERNLSANGLELDVRYYPPGEAPRSTLPLDGPNATQSLLTVTGLDRRTEGGLPTPDTRFDYLEGVTVRAADGLVVFPYLEPFGERLRTFVQAQGGAATGADTLLAFPSLYLQRKDVARRDARYEVYRLQGVIQGASQNFFDLGAFGGLVRGSVRVTSNGVALREDADYRVDYDGGTVTIVNPAYTSAGRGLSIDYEQNSLFALQKKTLLGLRADYTALGERLQLGSTMMQLTQRSQLDKFRIGDEPVSNLLWGLDGRFRAEPRFLTRWADALPFYATRAPSRVNVTAEFAQLRPGIAQTLAFQQALDRNGALFGADERAGLSYLDDFEAFENKTTLQTPSSWTLASAPDSVGALRSPRDLASWRMGTAWYTLTSGICERLPGGCARSPATRLYYRRDIFPVLERDQTTQVPHDILDLYVDPRVRGPYNQTLQYASFFGQPERAWGGMMTRLPEGYTDFEVKNIEFVELVLRPHSDAPGGDAGPGAFLYLDLGRLSEDVIPDGQRNSEDGLELDRVSPESLPPGALARLPLNQPDNLVAVETSTRRTEDIGIDGLVSMGAENYPDEMREATFHAAFLAALRQQATTAPWAAAERVRSEEDPSGDDFRSYTENEYFEDERRWPGGATPQQRFLRFFPATELNSLTARGSLPAAGSRDGLARTPDGEGMLNAVSVNTENAYFQYRIPLSTTALAAMTEDRTAPLVVRPVQDGWYLVRVPVRNWTRRVNISSGDFSALTHLRLWTSGHAAPATVRFASVEIVGSQWQGSDRIRDERADAVGVGQLSVEAVNTEDDAAVYTFSPKTVRPIVRTGAGSIGGGSGLQREQSLGLRVDRLERRQQRAVFKTYNQGYNLLKYTNLRMEAHVRATLAGTELDGPAARGRLRLFVRLGQNETNDYYEIEQPLTPTALRPLLGPDGKLRSDAAATLWRDDVNALNVRLSALNLLRSQRDQAGVPTTTLVYHLNEAGGADPRFSIDTEDFGVPGMRLGIKGSPSLSRVTSMVIGVRADGLLNQPGEVLGDIVLWANELRVSGYDAGSGWSAIANADVALADLATVRGSFRTQTDGFGALTSTLDQRDQTAAQNWNLQADLQLHRFLPSRYGWSLPVSVQASQSLATPRFAPGRGDVLLDDLYGAIDARQTDASGAPISDAERDALRRTEREAAETYAQSRSLTLSASKTGSRSAWIRNTVEATRLSFSAQQAEGRSPSQAVDEGWSWQGAAAYTLPEVRPRTVRPLWFLPDAPVLRSLGRLRLNYLPGTVGFDATAVRSFRTDRARRPIQTTSAFGGGIDRPELVQYPFRDNHSFTHSRSFRLTYTPFTFLSTAFDSNVQQTATLVGVDSLFSIVRRASDGSTTVETTRDGTFARDAARLNPSSTFYTARLDLAPLSETLGRIVGGDDRFRTEAYGQRFTATLTPRLPRSWEWLAVRPISATTSYGWQNAPLGFFTGASVVNALQLATAQDLRLRTLLRDNRAYRRIEEAQRLDQQAVQRIRARNDAFTAARRSYDERLREYRAAVERRRTDSTVALPPEPTAPVRDTTEITRAPLGKRLLRQLLLGLTSMETISTSYNFSRSASSNGVVPDADSTRLPYSFLDAVLGRGVPLDYRFGLSTTLPRGDRYVTGTLAPSDLLRTAHTFDANTALALTPQLNVTLRWQGAQEMNENRSFALGADRTTRSGLGSVNVTAWNFGSRFPALFRDQLAALRADLDASGTTFEDANGDGLALSPGQLEGAFRRAVAVSPLVLGRRMAVPLPMPSWRITYGGLHQLPGLRRFLAGATLQHAYSGTYRGAYDARPDGLPVEQLLNVNSALVRGTYLPGPFEGTVFNAEHRFAPLVGVDLRFKNNLTARVGLNRTRLNAMQVATRKLTENTTSDLSVQADYRVDRLRLPLLGRRLSNQLTLTLTGNYALTDQREFQLDKAVTDAYLKGVTLEEILGDANTYVNVQADTRRLTITPTVSYVFSNTVQARFNMVYERVQILRGVGQAYDNLRGGFSVVVNLNAQ